MTHAMSGNHTSRNERLLGQGTIETGIQALRREIAELRTQNAQQHEAIRTQKEDICTLRETVRVLTRHNDGKSDDDGGEGHGAGDDVLPDAIWDDFDSVQRCVTCTTEVVDGFCTGPSCMLQHAYESDGDEAEPDESISTADVCVRSARLLAPRGTTPLRELHEDNTPHSKFEGSKNEYTALLQRGATRLMISTFHLEFTNKSGIVAWADSQIYDAWAGPDMRKGQFWKIMLGRMIKLDADDLDGSVWLEDFLEDALTAQNGMWETVLDSPRIWVTRPSAKSKTTENCPGEKPQDVVIDDSEGQEGEGDEGEEAEGEGDGGGEAEGDEEGEGEEGEDQDGEGEDGKEENGQEMLVFDDSQPIECQDQYESSDIDMDELIDEPEGPLFDTIDTDSDNAYDSMSDDDVVETAVKIEEDDLTDDDDEPGSDWDSQEELSGDELALNTVMK